MLLFAHGIVGRADLPIPQAWFWVAAAVVLVVSFAALAGGWTRPRLERIPERPLFRIPLAVEIACGAIGFAVFAVTVYAGLAGTDSQTDNLAPTAVYVGFWVGVPFLSLLLGDWFRLFNPWRAVGRAFGSLAKGAETEAFPYPERLGHWPAVAGILAFVICELTWGAAREPGPLAVLKDVAPPDLAATLGVEPMIDTPEKFLGQKVLQQDADDVGGTRIETTVALNVSTVDTHADATLAGCSYRVEIE